MEQHAHFSFALEYVDDISAARRFYTDVLGLEAKREHPQFVQFDGFAIASDPSMSGGKEREVYFTVDDAEAAFAERAKNTKITMDLKSESFGKVFGVEGPAGQPVYFVEFAAQRPSSAVGNQPNAQQH